MPGVLSGLTKTSAETDEHVVEILRQIPARLECATERILHLARRLDFLGRGQNIVVGLRRRDTEFLEEHPRDTPGAAH